MMRDSTRRPSLRFPARVTRILLTPQVCPLRVYVS